MKSSAITPAIASAIDRPIHRGVYRPFGGGRRKSLSRRFADILKGRTAIAYDHQDLATLFQDATGTLPVYRPGTGLVDPPVGLMLDKSRGLELGQSVVSTASVNPLPRRVYRTSEENVIATFSTAGSGFQRGKTYKLTMSVNTNVGSTDISVIGSRCTVISQSTILVPAGYNGDLEYYVTVSAQDPGTGDPYIYVGGQVGFDFMLEAIDFREIKGFHAYQTTPTARPPLSGRYNLLTATETLSTQSVTTVATNYTLKFEGTGTITLSGTATGTYSAGTHTITCTAGTLTCTVAGSVTKADLRVKRDGSSLPAYQSVTSATTYDTAGFPLFLKRDKVDDVLTCVAPAITGFQGMGSTGGAVLGPVIIPAGTYTPLSELATTGIPEITRYVAIDGALTASEQAVVEQYLLVTSSGVFANKPVFSFGLTSVASFSFTLQTKADTAPVLINWGDGTQSTHAGAADQTASHTYAVSGTYAVKVYGADQSVLTRFSTSAAGMSGDLVMPAGMTHFSCGGSNTLSGPLGLPSGMTYFNCSGSNTLTGTLSLPDSMTYFSCAGFNTISGTVSIPLGMTTFLCTGSNTLSGYTPSAKASNQGRFLLAGLNTMSATDVDNILIDYAAAGGTWGGAKDVTIQGNAANRTSASDAAYASLATKLTTLSVD